MEQKQDLELFEKDRIALIARDLRDPVVHVIEHIDQVLEGGEPLTAKQRAQLTRARDGAAHLRAVVEDVQDAARFLQGHLCVQLSPQDMRSLISDSIERNAHLAAGKSISLISELPATALRVNLDRRLILQVLNNLISNAIKFSGHGTTIRVGARRTSAGIEAWVADQGQGMQPYELPRLFQKFSGAHSRATAGERGTGLGLYIVAEALRLHQGTIRVTTEPGKGSTFTFLIPRRGAAGSSSAGTRIAPARVG